MNTDYIGASLEQEVPVINHDAHIEIIQVEQLSQDLTLQIMNSPSFPDFHLKTLLSISPMGTSILKHYETHNSLINSHQNRLVDIIISHIYTYVVKR